MIKRIITGAVATISLSAPFLFSAAPAHAWGGCPRGQGVLVTYRPQVGAESWSKTTVTKCITRWQPVETSGSLLLDARIVSVDLNGMPGLKLGIHREFIEGRIFTASQTMTVRTDRSILIRGSIQKFEDSWGVFPYGYTKFHTAQSVCPTRNGVDCV